MTVNTPLFKVRPTIKGVFGNYQDIFDPAQHRLSYTMCGGTRMEPVLKNVELVKLKSKLPFIESFFDGMSRQSNTVITPGGNVEIKGDCDKIQVRLIERIFKAGNQLVIYKIQDNLAPFAVKEDS